MFQHLITLIWNKKRQHFLLFLELFVSFLVLFAVFTLLVFNYGNLRQPRGFDYQNVLSVSMTNNFPGNPTLDSTTLIAQNMKRAIQGIPGVAAVAYSSNNSPYTMNDFNNSISHNNISVQAQVLTADDDLPSVLHTQMTRGRWFGKEDAAGAVPPVVINSAMAEKLFGNDDPVGTVLDVEGKKKVVGVIHSLKDKGDYVEAKPGFYTRSDSGLRDNILIRLKADAPPAAESQIYKTIMHHIPTSTTEIEKLEDKRVVRNRLALIPVILMLVISGFLVLNVALGIYGVVWYSVNKRRAEIGLRKAVGATPGGITRQILGEVLVLTTLPLLLGIILAVQFPMLRLFDLPAATYMIAILLAAAFLYLLVTLCALYPGRQAAKIYPAVALHED